ncbi:MAG TPA: cellulase family glycosylhydrolase [Polyangiaceae bacterium]|nr:cellulase family glycosylhydrolase [Polyangiaceae bacterium]
MHRSGWLAQSVLGLAWLAGCGAGDDTGAPAPPFEGAAPVDGVPMMPASGMNEPSTNAPSPNAGSEGTDPGLGLEPSQPAPGTGETPTPEQPEAPAVPGLLFGNGRVIGDDCTLVCVDASTDPDAQGLTDGWGFERGRSCLTPESALALESDPCDIPELAPLPPLPAEIPEGNVRRPDGMLTTGFFVTGGRLFDRFGADFVMRGINHPVAWFQNDALAWMDEIASTGSNSVRLVWETDRGSPTVIRASIERAVELGMVPIVELHDVTGSTDVGGPARMAQYYVDEMRDILLEFEPYLLINIANEWGAFNTSDADWVQAYRQAISVMRDAGLNHTLVIDASNYGQRGAAIVAEGAGLLEFDPQHNILFSTHMYQEYENPQSMLDVMRGVRNAGLALIVGEFGFQHGNRNGQPIPVPYTTMLDEAARVGVGYLAWSWTGNSQDVGYLDMSENGSAAQLTGWGDDIINGMNGIRSTSEPASIFAGP